MTDTLIAGRELDALIAERVMGATKAGAPGFWMFSTVSRWLPTYSTDIAAAWEVVAHLAAKGSYVCVEHVHKPENRWNAWVGGENVYAATAPLAICLAALKAVGQ